MTKQWLRAQAVLPAALPRTTSLVLNITLDGDAGCVLLDDVSVIKD